MSQSSVLPQTAPPRLRFRVSLQPSHLLRARDRIRDYLRQYCTEPAVIDDIVLCVEEAATNAIRHSGSDRDIEISLRFGDDDLLAQVKDHGRGFDLATFDLAVPDGLSDHGRGLFIVAQLMDSLELSFDDGLEVKMARHATPRCETGALESGVGEQRAALGGIHGVARTRALLDEIEEGFIALDWECRCVYVNQAALHVVGKTSDELLGHTPWEVFPELQTAPLHERCREAMELGKPSVSEHPSIFDEAWREVRIYPTITGVSAYFNDITERKRAEEELKRLSAEAQRRNRVLTGAKKILSAALGSVSEEELGRLCLSVAEEITDSGFGFIGEVNGEGLYDIALSDPGWQACTMTDQSGHRAPLEFKLHGLYGEVVTSGRSLLTNAPAQHPASIGTPPGHPPLSAFLGAPLRSGDRVIGLIGVGNREGGYRDTDRESLEELTEALVQAFERRRAEQMLREHEERFRLLHDTMLQGVVYQEADGAIISMNAAAERILGKGPQDFLGLSSVAVEHDTLREDGSPFPGLEHPAMVALRTGQPVPGVIMQVYNPREARYRVIDIQAVPLFRPGEADPYRVYAVFDDVTEAKQAERERRQLLEQARSQAEEVWAQSEELRAQRDTIVRELESTSLLLEAAETSAKTAPLSDVLDQLARVVLRLSGHSRATFSSWHEEPRRMEVVHSAGENPLPAGFTISLDDMSADGKAAVTEGRPALVDYDALEQDHRGPGERVTLHCVLHVPLCAQSRLTGFLAVDDPRERREFSDREIQLIEGIAAHAAAVIENAHIHDAETAARQSAQRELERTRLLQEVTTAATGSLSLPEIGRRVLELTRQSLGATGGAIYAVGENEDELHALALSGFSEERASRVAVVPLNEHYVMGEMVVHDLPLVTHDSGPIGWQSQEHARQLSAADERWFALPIRRGDAVVGVFGFMFAGERAFTDDELSLYRSIAELLGGAFENARLFEAERAARQQAAHDLETTRLLLEASGTLNRWTDLDVMLNGLATVVLNASKHTRVYVALLAEDRSHATFVTTVGDVPLPARTVLTWDQLSSVLQDVLTDGRRRIVDFDELPKSQHGVADSLASRLALHVPIVFGNRVLGHIAIDDPGERSEFTDREIALVEGIASQAAVAIENAQLYEGQRRIAETLQANFVHQLPNVAGLELGVVSRRAYEPELVGGDFSDVFLVDDRHVVALIGDVAGKGVKAAGMTETVRSTVRALATIDPSPAFVLGAANDLLLRFDPDEPHVTAFCAVLDPNSGHLGFASAGHPAPIHLRAFSTLPLDVAFGPPLGTFAHAYANAYATLTLEDYLVLYTDGVTEARQAADMLGEKRLLEVVSGLRGRSAQEVADGVADAALAFGGRLLDDLQVVVLRLA